MRGHIRKRGKKYYVVVDIGRDENGKRKQKWMPYDSSQEAETALAEIITKIKKGTFVLPNKMTVAEYLQYWLDECAELESTTYDVYVCYVNSYILPHIGTMRLQEITPLHLQSLKTTLITEGRVRGEGGLAYASIVKVFTILDSAFDYAVGLRLMETNPAKAVKLSRPESDEPAENVYDLEQLAKLFSACKNTKWEAPIYLAAFLGLRRGEVLGLEWKNINFERRILFISQVMAVTTGEVFLKPRAKNKQSKRALVMPKTLVTFLKTHHARQSEQKLALGEKYHDNDLICCKKNGDYINPKTFSVDFKRKFIEKNNLPPLTFHGIRHTFATALMNEVSLKAVADFLGHIRTETTAEIYSHVLLGTKMDTADKIDEIIGSVC